MTTFNGWVVVQFTDSQCDEYPDMKCTMDVTGPFDTDQAARAYMDSCPEWTRPHKMQLHSAEGE